MGYRISLLCSILFTLCSCGNNTSSSHAQSVSVTGERVQINHEVWSTYFQTSDTVYEVNKLMLEQGAFRLVKFRVIHLGWEMMRQEFAGSRMVSKDSVEELKARLTSIKPDPWDTVVLFVQIQPSAFTNVFQALDMRGNLELELDSVLKRGKRGWWIAGDIGPGGAN